MRNFLLLTKVLSKNGEMAMPKEGKKASTYKMLGSVALLCIMIPCCLIVGFIVYIMTEALIEAGGRTEGLELVVQLMSVFGLIFSVMVLFNVLYFSSDLNHLLPLPVKPGELVAAKFVNAYIAESVMEFLILFSGFVGYFIAAGIKPVSLLTAVLGVFLLPVLPLVYCGIFALLTMAFLSRIKLFRNVDFITGLITILFTGLFLLSFAQMDSININNYIDGLLSHNNLFTEIMGKLFFTVPIFLKAIETNSILYCLLFLLLNVAMAALLFFLGSKLYLRGVYLVSSMGRKEKKENLLSASSFTEKSAKKAYFLKECKILYRTPAYRKYCVLVNAAWPIIVAALFFLPATKGFMASFEKTFANGYVASDLITLLLVLIIAFFATAMNSIASTSFTREGAHFSFIKHVPLDFYTQIRIKAAVSIVYSGITTAISILILCFFMKVSAIGCIYFLVIGMLSVVCGTYIGIMLDAAHPELDWEDEYGALRGNLNAFYNMAIAILIALVLCVVGFVLFQYTKLHSDMIFLIYLVVLIFVTFRIRKWAIKFANKSISNDLYN